MLRISKSQRLHRVVLMLLLSLLFVACSKEGDLDPVVEADPDTTPPPKKDAELETIDQVFLGEYGCQRNPALSVLNFDSDASVDQSTCVGSTETVGTNPSQLFVADLGVHTYLDTEIDTLREHEFLLYASGGATFLVDLENSENRRLASFPGLVCRLIASKKYEAVYDSGTNTETWHELNDKFVYAEVVFDSQGFNVCDDASRFRTYFQVPINFDEFADDFEVCATEPDGKSQAADCKSRLAPAVSAAQALSSPVKAYVLDESTSDPSDRRLVYGHLGWGADERKLSFWDDSFTLVWSQNRNLESFDVIEGKQEGAYQELVHITELEDAFYSMQLGRDLFLFQGRSLFEASSSDNIFSDRIYQLDERTGATSDTFVKSAQLAFDADDFILFDNGKFFHTNYKTSYSAPVTARNYAFVNALSREYDEYDHFEFSQFHLADCQYDADVASCDAANNVGAPGWQVTEDCDALLGCSIPVDSNDYCVTEAERTGTTTEDELCTASRFEDLNELNEVANDLSFKSFLPFYADYMRDLDFQITGNRLLMNLRLSERDALVFYDFNEPLTSPKSDREQLLFGARLVQSMSRPVVLDNGIYVTSQVRGSLVSNSCFKGLIEVQCNLSKMTVGSSDECTTFDLNAGTCREGRYLFESRALFCSDTNIANSSTECDDDNQVNTVERQIESPTQDAQWLPTLSISSVGVLEKQMRVLLSDERQQSTLNPTLSYTKDEGVLGNPSLYGVNTSAASPVLGTVLGQLNGQVESIPGYMVLRNGEGTVSVNAEEFVGSADIRQQDELYVNEASNKLVRVAGSEKAQ